MHKVIPWLCLLLLTACTNPRLERKLTDVPIGPGWQPQNVYAQPTWPVEVVRVAVLPLHSASVDGADRIAVEALLLTELRRAGRFELINVPADLVFTYAGAETLPTDQPIAVELLEWLRGEWSIDAVLQQDLTAYRPYRPYVIGLRSRLFDINDGSLIWAIDELIDAADKTVFNSARKFAKEHLHEQFPYADSHAVFRSPGRFTRFAAFTLYQTLPVF